MISFVRSLPVTVVLFLAILAFSVMPGCSGGDKPAASGEDKAAAEESASGADVSAMQALLPGAGEAGDWDISGEPRFFVPANLWEYINGGAEGYLVYNFVSVVTADYETTGGIQAVVDIYQMADQLCGFGIYSAERNSFAPRVDIGSEGYVTDNAVHFWQGPYYVKVTAFETGKEQELEVLARSVSGKLNVPSGNPPQLAAFPRQGLTAGSERYMARDVLGHSELKNGFSADYELDGKEFKLFFLLHEDTGQAATSFEVYHKFMEQYSEGLEDQTGAENPMFTAQDSYYGKVVAMQTGRAVMVSLGLDDPEQVNSFLQKLTQNLISQGVL